MKFFITVDPVNNHWQIINLDHITSAVFTGGSSPSVRIHMSGGSYTFDDEDALHLLEEMGLKPPLSPSRLRPD